MQTDCWHVRCTAARIAGSAVEVTPRMNTELFTVSKVFTECLYRIPDYQRGYSWGDIQLKDFWLDLEQLEESAKHYTGVLTLEEVPEEKWRGWEDDRWIIKSRRYRPYYVVDGQQRLTTVVILLQCILESTTARQLNYTPIEDIRRKYIYDSKPEESARSYIFGYEKDNPSYEYLKRRIFNETSDQHALDEETIYTKNLQAAKDFFLEELQKLSPSATEQLFTKVTQQLVFNVYEIATDIDVFVTFETMNNRGKPLSTLELLKNRLIFLSTKLPASEENGKDLRRAINDAWKTGYHYLGKNDDRPLDDDEFLRTHLATYYPRLVKIPTNLDEDDGRLAFRAYEYVVDQFSRFLLNDLFTPKRLRGENKKLPPLTRTFLYDFSQQLKSSVELYYKLSTPADSTFTAAEQVALERIGRLEGHSPSYLLLALFMKEKDAKKRAAVLEQYERLIFCQSLMARAPFGNRYRWRHSPVLLVKFISGEISTDELLTQFENTVTAIFRESSLSEVLYEWVKNGPSYYGWRSIKYFLFEYELELQMRTKSSRQKLEWKEFIRENYQSDFATVEHIYPQRARDRYWTDRFSRFSSTQKRLLRNSLGNLLPLAKPRNSSLGNRSFPEKLGDEITMTGYRFGCYSENEVAQAAEWGPGEILERGVRLLEFLERRWRLPIGDRNQKIRALGLDFLRSS